MILTDEFFKQVEHDEERGLLPDGYTDKLRRQFDGIQVRKI